MAIFLKNYDLDAFAQSEDTMRVLWSMVIERGKAVQGYSGLYINHHLGDAQMIIRTVQKANGWNAVGLDTHSAGRCVWDLRVVSTLPDEDHDPLQKRCLVTGREGGMTVVDVVNADVLPSFAEDEEISLQMIAASSDFHYYADTDAYNASLPVNEQGKIWGIGEGSVIPVGFLNNHSVPRKNDPDSEADRYVCICARVKRLYHGQLQLDEERWNGFIRCILDTHFGELEFVHTYDQVPPGEHDNIRVGSIVSGVFTLSGDAAINNYENGFVRDHETHLKLLRYTFTGADPDRLRPVLAGEAVYESDLSQQSFHGAEAVIRQIRYVQEHCDGRYYAYPATITSVDGEEEGLYPAGTRCLVLAFDDPDACESIAFVDTDEDGNISSIHTSTNSRYHFRLDPKPDNDLPVELPESAAETLLHHAGMIFLKEKVTPEELEQTLSVPGPYTAIAGERAAGLDTLNDEPLKQAVTAVMTELFLETFRKQFPARTHDIGPMLDKAREQAALAPRDFLNLHRFIQSDDRQMKEDLFRCLVAVQLIAARYATELAQTPPSARA